MKATAIFLQNVMGYTFQSTNCGAGRSWVSTEKNGTNGSFGGSDWIFTESSSEPFSTSDADKYLVVRDDTNPRNGGIYRIRRYISSTQVEIDFKSDFYYEWPTASTGISWWVVARTYELPSAHGDQVRLQSRHSTGWAVELNYHSTYNAVWVRVAVTGDWGGKVITSGSPSLGYGFTTTSSSCGAIWNAEGDYDGEWLHLWLKQVDYNTSFDESVGGVCGGIMISRIDPIESGHSSDELLVVCGNTNAGFLTAWLQNGFNRSTDDRSSGHVAAWSDNLNSVLDGYMLESTAAGWGNGFSHNYYRQPNRRIGNKIELVQGTIVILDPNNVKASYQILGRIKGHYTSRAFCSGLGRCGTIGYRHLPLTKDSSKDLLMIQDGWIIAWPGVTPQV